MEFLLVAKVGGHLEEAKAAKAAKTAKAAKAVEAAKGVKAATSAFISWNRVELFRITAIFHELL